MQMTDAGGLALMLSGGGARAAYQVGVLRYLAREFPATIPDILTGVSAGGINAAFIAARQGPYPEKIEQLAKMWRDLHIDQVFDVDIRDLAWRTLRWSGRLASGGIRRCRTPRVWSIRCRYGRFSSASFRQAADRSGHSHQLA
jgi:NTE family protein